MNTENQKYEELKNKYEKLVNSYDNQIDKIIQLEMIIADLKSTIKRFKIAFNGLISVIDKE